MVTSSSSGHDESCESLYAYGLSVHQKSSNYTLTNLLFGLFKFVWIIDSLVIHPSPHPRALTCNSTFEVLWVNQPILIPFSSVIFTFKFAFVSYEEFGVHHRNIRSKWREWCKAHWDNSRRRNAGWKIINTQGMRSGK